MSLKGRALAAINAAEGIATMLDTVKKTMLDGNNTERWRLGTLFVWALAYIKASTISERCIHRLHTFSSAERLSRLLLLDCLFTAADGERLAKHPRGIEECPPMSKQ